ncbi:MAG: hypothetical protein HY023_06405 [Chloroflexi bacterium]|nr:hypothetical protein [Chloroflexota bacterium]
MNGSTHATTEMQLLEYAERLFAPLLREGLFDSFERAFRALLLDYVERKIETYKRKIAEFEARYQQTFEAYSAALQGRATPDEEEVWIDWEVALTFLRKWQKIHAQIAADGSA